MSQEWDKSQAMSLEPMELSDLDAVMQIEARSYSHPWTRGNFEDSLNAGYTLMCAWREAVLGSAQPELLGYYVTMPVMDEVHLLNITVSPDHWRQGLGRWMLSEVHAQAERSAASSVWLEVRPSNAAALAMYQRHGFALVGRRRDYYPLTQDKREDALLLKLLLGAPGAQV